MTNFVLLFSGGSGMPEDEAVIAASMKAWETWYANMGDAVADGGNPFTPMAKSVAPDRSVSDGPAGTMYNGYTIVSADSLDAAVELAKGCPILDDGGEVSVYETFQIG
jgi:hypothetical protein